MKWKQERKLFDAITEIRDDLIEQAQDAPVRYRRPKWTNWAACAVLLLGVSGILLQYSLVAPGGDSGMGDGGNGGGFMSYAAPVFPLTLRPQEEITAARRLTYDFSSADEEDLRKWGAQVSDSYTLHNSSDQEKTVTAVYPFAGNLNELSEQMPSVLAEGRPVTPMVYAGDYSGGFAGAVGEENPEGSFNLEPLNNWEGYKALMEDGSYQEQAFLPAPLLSQKVTVYEFSDFHAPLEEYPAATQAISFTIDPNKTTILQYGFEGMEWEDNGFRRYSYFVPNGKTKLSERKALIVLGEDIGKYAMQGYQNGACEKGNELEGVSAEITSSQMTLSEIVDQLITEYFSFFYDSVEEDGSVLPGVSKELFSGAVAELLHRHGILAGTVAERYEEGRLMDLFSDTQSLQRVFYLEFPVTIPGGASVSVEMNMHKFPSYDFACSGSENVGLQGYDMVTRLGSNLRFEEQAARITHTEAIEIVHQNFGFNLSTGVAEVRLDPDTEHYYLEIKPVQDKEETIS